MRKNVKKWKISGVCHFRCQFETFYFYKTAIISSEMPAGQRISAPLSSFKIQIYEVFQTFYSNCMKMMKNKILFFLSFSESI